MNQSIQEFIIKAEEIKKLESQKEFYIEKIQELKTALEEYEKKLVECMRKLAEAWQNIKSKN